MSRARVVLALCLAAGAAGAARLVGDRSYDSMWARGTFLSRGVGARATAMGGAFTAIADDASAAFWNPGGLGQLKSLSAVAQYDAMGLGMAGSYLAVAAPVGGVVGAFSVQTMSYGTIQYRDETGAKTTTDSLMDGAVTQAWAFRNPSWLGGAGWTGIGVELVQEAMDNALFGLNAGSLFLLSSRVTAGWAVRHSWFPEGDYFLPSVFHLGTAYHGDRLRGAMDLSYGMVDHLMSVGIGGELRLHPSVVARLGYHWDGQDQGIGGFRGVSAGAGFRLGRFAVDYAYQPFGDLAVTHRLSAEYRLPVRATASATQASSSRKAPSVRVMPDLPRDMGEERGLTEPARSRTASGAVPRKPVPSPSVPTAPGGPAATTGPAAKPLPTGQTAPAAPAEPAVPEEAPPPESLLPPPSELESEPGDGGGLLAPADGKRGKRDAGDGGGSSFGVPRGERP